MRIGYGRNVVFVLLACAAACAAQASPVWNEDLNGDFSNDGLSPTPVTMDIGSNTIFGRTGADGPIVDRDYFTFTVPVGTMLSSIMLLPETSVVGGVSFFGLQSGSQLTVTPSGGGAENLLLLGHYGNDFIGQDLLAQLAVGFTGPLPSGTYSAWVQDTSSGFATYGLDFGVSAVPLPGAVWLLGSGVMGLAALRRRRLKTI